MPPPAAPATENTETATDNGTENTDTKPAAEVTETGDPPANTDLKRPNEDAEDSPAKRARTGDEEAAETKETAPETAEAGAE